MACTTSALRLCLSVLLVTVASALEVSVTTESQLLSALATPAVSLIRLLEDIKLSPATVVPGADSASGVYTLTRNVSVTSAAGQTGTNSWYPTLDFNYCGAKVHLPAGVTLSLQHLFLERLSQQIGIYDIDFVQSTSLGTVQLDDTVYLSTGCLPVASTAASFSEQASRAASIPGKQTATASPASGTYCSPSRPVTASGGGGDPSASTGCWGGNLTFRVVDIALNLSFWDTALSRAPVNTYNVWSRNSLWICDQIFDSACVAQHGGIYQCWAAVLGADVAAATNGTAADAAPPPPDPSTFSEVSVSTDTELLTAIGDPAVVTIRLLKDVVMSPETLVPGADGSSGLYTMARNVTVTAGLSAAAGGWYPTLDMNYVGSKVLLPAGVTFTLQHLFLKRISQTVGIFDLDFFDSASLGTVIENDTVYLSEGCLPVEGTAASFSQQSTRFATITGNQTATPLPGGWCAPPPPAGGDSSSSAPAACWPSNQTFSIVDVALNMSFWDVRIGRPKANNYAVWARNSTWICDQIFDASCVTRYGGVFPCWAAVLDSAVRDADRSSTPAPPGWTRAVQPDVAVSSETELLAALGNPDVVIIRLLQDIRLNPGTVIPGADATTGMYMLTRNVTITTAAGKTAPTDWYPTLDFGYVGVKMLIPAGVALFLQHLFIQRVSQQIGVFDIDFIDHSSLGAVVRTDTVYLSEACLPVETTVASLNTPSSRYEAIPGAQSAVPLPDGWCAPERPANSGGSSSGSGASNGGGGGGGSNAGTCWAGNVTLLVVDVALNTSFWDTQLSSPQINNYVAWTRNSTWLCAQVFGNDCIAKYGGVAGCWSALLLAAVVASNATLHPPPPPSVFPLPPPANNAGGGGSDGFPAWAIGVIVGVVALLAIVGAAAGALLYRRRRASAVQKGGGGGGVPAGRGLSLEALVSKRAGVAAMGQDGRVPGSGSLSLHPESPEWDSFNFSSTSGRGNMLDECESIATTGSRPTTQRVDPGELASQLTSKSALMRDEQLELIKVLGRGGGGIVYQGLWKGLPVAAKVMIVHEEQHDQARRQILEATMSTSLSHPNIVNTYNYDLRRLGSLPGSDERPVLGKAGAFATAWQLVILQELCKGGALRRMMDRKVVSPSGKASRYLDQRHVLMLAHDVSSGLEHLHIKNVIHSDMTANNVLLQTADTPRPAGLLWTAKVADFGLSNAMEDGRSQISHVFAGTPHYIAPETQTKGIISKSSDIFAFGILLYEMMAGSSVGGNYTKVEVDRPGTVAQLNTASFGGASDSDAGEAGRGQMSVTDSVHSAHHQLLAAGSVTRATAQLPPHSARAAAADANAPPPAAVTAAAEAAAPSSPPPPVPLYRGDSAATCSMTMIPGSHGVAVGTKGTLNKGSASGSACMASVTIEIEEERTAGVSDVHVPPASSTGSRTHGGGTSYSMSSRSPPVLMGGGRGHHGGSVVLPPLPDSVPPEYVLLVEACLNPEPQERPTIAAVRRQLTHMVKQYVLPGVPEGSTAQGAFTARVTDSGLLPEEVGRSSASR